MPNQSAPNLTEFPADNGIRGDALLPFEDDLPALPATMGKLLRLVEDPNAGIDDIGQSADAISKEAPPPPR